MADRGIMFKWMRYRERIEQKPDLLQHEAWTDLPGLWLQSSGDIMDVELGLQITYSEWADHRNGSFML